MSPLPKAAQTCRLTPTPTDPHCPIQATPGTVTLRVSGTQGSVQFESAKYNGSDIPGTPSPEITFTIVSGETDLDVAYAFSDPQNGAGKLTEVCANNTFLGNVHASITSERLHICA